MLFVAGNRIRAVSRRRKISSLAVEAGRRGANMGKYLTADPNRRRDRSGY